MNKDCSDGSDENDIFVVKRLKPIGQLTREKALDIKKNVLNEEMNDLNYVSNKYVPYEMAQSDKKNCQETSPKTVIETSSEVMDDNEDELFIFQDKSIPKILESTPAENEWKRKRTSPTKTEKSTSKLITSYYSPSKKPTTFDDEYNEISERKKITYESISSKSNCGKRNSGSNATDSTKTHNVGSPVPNKRKGEFHKNYHYSSSLKEILNQGISNQKFLEANNKGKEFDKLITDTDLYKIERFVRLPENALELFSRMLGRKRGWHRIGKISYDDFEDKIEELFKCLNKEMLVDFDVEKEDNETMLNMLGKSEVQGLCNKFNIKSTTGRNKSDFIKAFLKSVQSQKSVIDIWSTESKSREQLLREGLIKELGPCMKLNESFLTLLNKVLLLFSLSQNEKDEEWWNKNIQLMISVNLKKVFFPQYEVKSTIIFEKLSDFTLYEKAVKLKLQYDEAFLNKDINKILDIGETAKIEFKQLLENESFKERFNNLPSFLRKFNAGSVYAKILTRYCSNNKKIKTSEEVIEIMTMLLNQDVFSSHRRGTWYDLLITAYSNIGKLDRAHKALLSALTENTINEVERFALEKRGQTLLKKSKNSLKNSDLRNMKDYVCSSDITEPRKVEIRGKALARKKPGSKIVYTVKDSTGEVTYLNVEQNVISQYKKNGFTKGIHDEGSVIKTLYCLVFFDIIYHVSPPGVFQNRFQSEPLDFATASFYLNRKTEIDLRIEQMRSWPYEKFVDFITKVYEENLDQECVISWKDYSADVLCEILKCLGTVPFTKICERLVRHYMVYRSGLPDLTLWNPSTGKCKFVEVKSPNDTLKPNQRLWLDFLRKLGVDCEVCCVKNTASKRPKSEPHVE